MANQEAKKAAIAQAAAVVGALAERYVDLGVQSGKQPPRVAEKLKHLAEDLIKQQNLDEGSVGIARHEYLRDFTNTLK